jgi:glycosyltransferase involved in cell wall biosynthesis
MSFKEYFMRILYLVHAFFPKYYAGTERFTFQLATQMQKMGHRPTVVTYEYDDDYNGFETLTERLMVKRYTYRTLPVIALKHASRPDDPFADVFYPELEEAAPHLQLDVNLVHVCHPMWLSNLAKYFKRTVPMVMTLTDAWLLCPSGLLDRDTKLCNGPMADGGCSSCVIDTRMTTRLHQTKEVYDMADELTAPSHFIQTIFEKNRWNRRISVIRHGIDYANVHEKTRPQKETVTFGFIGSVILQKGVHILIKAARKVSNRNLRVKIYGSPKSQPNYFKRLLELAEGDDRIKFLGAFEEEELPEIMNSLSALVVPSTYYENYPYTVSTALAYNVPPIASRIGALPEMINDANGFLFEAGNSNELARIMERIMNGHTILDDIRNKIERPRRIEEEALDYENMYRALA